MSRYSTFLRYSLIHLFTFNTPLGALHEQLLNSKLCDTSLHKDMRYTV